MEAVVENVNLIQTSVITDTHTKVGLWYQITLYLYTIRQTQKDMRKFKK